MIREATTNDIKSIAEVITLCWQTAYEGIISDDYPVHLKKERFEEIFEKNIKNHIEKIFIFEKYDQVIGFVSGKLNDTNYDSQVVGLYVHPDHQQNQVGTKLIDTIKKYFRDQRCKNMIIWTLLNAKNNQFYKKLGGEVLENKELQFGDRKYTGVGFVFEF